MSIYWFVSYALYCLYVLFIILQYILISCNLIHSLNIFYYLKRSNFFLLSFLFPFFRVYAVINLIFFISYITFISFISLTFFIFFICLIFFIFSFPFSLSNFFSIISNAVPPLSHLFSYHFHSIVFYSIVFYSVLSNHFIFFSSIFCYHFIFFSSSQVDLLLIESEEFSPELVMQLSLDLKIQPSFMFIRCPGENFPYNLGDFRGVRTIMQ